MTNGSAEVLSEGWKHPSLSHLQVHMQGTKNLMQTMLAMVALRICIQDEIDRKGSMGRHWS